MTDEEQHDLHSQALEQTGFWGRRAAGCLFLARDTGRILLSHRSLAVLEPGTWGTFGGAVDDGETEEEAVAREVLQETEYAGRFELLPLARFAHASGFTYQNYLAVVDSEFQPVLDGENQGFAWVDASALLSSDPPVQPLHPGLDYLLKHSGATIADAVAGCASTSSASLARGR